MYILFQSVMKIKTVKPEKATGIENSIINAARNGMLKNRVSEAELVSLLEKDSASRGPQTVTVKSCLISSKEEESMISGDISN
jgi:DNA-binding TFAR19-related protein (PDSD5 family)